MALSKIFLRRPHGEQQVIHAQNYRSTAAAFRARPHQPRNRSGHRQLADHGRSLPTSSPWGWLCLSVIPLIDEKLQFSLSEGERNQKFRVINSLPSNPKVCPLVRKTSFLKSIVKKDLKLRVKETLAKYDPDLLRRTSAYLYLKVS